MGRICDAREGIEFGVPLESGSRYRKTLNTLVSIQEVDQILSHLLQCVGFYIFGLVRAAIA